MAMQSSLVSGLLVKANGMIAAFEANGMGFKAFMAC